MDDKPRHRGRHPADQELFAAEQLEVLRTAVFELSWLIERGYSSPGALALVGNRHELRERQRKAVLRCSCGDRAQAARRASRVRVRDLAGQSLMIDGFNCVITLEAAMAGGVVLVGRDGAHRDMSSVHGSYRRVDETRQAVAYLAELLATSGVASVGWLLDRPVSNSGRLKAVIEDAAPPGVPWDVELVYNPDRDLREQDGAMIASSDAWVLDGSGSWVDLPGAAIERFVDSAWLVDLGYAGLV